jgi:soluble lytic murein transglycosylase
MTKTIPAGFLTFSLLSVACGPTSSVITATAPPSTAAPIAAPVTPAAATLADARTQRDAGDLAAYERSLLLLAESSDPEVSKRAQTQRALFLHEQKRWDDAVRQLERAARLNPAIAPFLELRVLTALEASNDPRGAAGIAAQIVANHPSTSAATVARLRLPALYAEAGDPASTDAAYRQAAAIAIDELTESELVELANRLAKANRMELANELRMRLLTTYTNGRFTEQTYGRLTAATDSPIQQLTLEESLNLAQKLARADRYDQALDLYKRTAERFPDAPTSDQYRAAKMRALFNSRNYGDVLAEAGTAPLDDPALILVRSRAAWRDDKPQLFLDGLAEVETKYAASKEALEAKVLRSKYYVTDEIDYERSIADLSAAIGAGVVGNEGENIWTLGWIELSAGHDDEALKLFDRYIRAYPDGDYKTNSLFWTAKILDKRGLAAERDAKARVIVAEYPFSYYSYRSKQLWPSIADEPIASTQSFPDVDAELARIADPRIETIRELRTAELHRDATREAKLLASAYPDNLGVAFLLADVYVEGGEPFKANTQLQRRFRQFVRHGGQNIPRRFWEVLFPLAYYDAIEAEAAKRNLDPYLVASIIRQESGFEPTTVSNAGAVGLMQIMPHEAPKIAEAAGISGMTRERLFDPRENIAMGTAEFSQKLAIMNGQYSLAIAAYNAGETPVSSWLEQTPADDLDRFIESIPYAETKLYVKTVTRNQHEYRRIYGK